ncbi:unnamed protein product [Rhizoctonia solani]|uniref:Uncharacterized protein n=1 Tax=Rhizoctonia solani TaxID=456999 RepID=A0A8H3BAW5_9AGAM|nr:unnamed protein product [Rhizoctonia solani]
MVNFDPYPAQNDKSGGQHTPTGKLITPSEHFPQRNIVEPYSMTSPQRLIQKPKLSCPPSPSSLPLVGNLSSIPSGHKYLVFTELGEQLKLDIVHLEILGHKLIILNSLESASEILNKCAVFYLDQPTVPMIKDPTLMNWLETATIIGYNNVWQKYCRIMNNWLNAWSVIQFDELQEQQAQSLLQQLLGTTNHVQPFKHVKSKFFLTQSAMGLLMLQLAYGYKPWNIEDPFFQGVELTMHNVTSAVMQTNFLVNLFLAMLYTLDWFPGMGWKHTAREYGTQQEKAKSKPYEWLKSQVANGTQTLPNCPFTSTP